MCKPTPGLSWTAALLAAAVLRATALASPAGAAPAARQGKAARLSIASPATGNLVAGLVQVAVAFDAGSAGRITAIELWVDDRLYSSQTLDLADPRGTHSIDWDTLQQRNGQHSLNVRAFSGRKVIASDSVVVSVSNGGVDVVPPLISFYAPLEGQIVSGSVNIGVNAADNDQVALVGLFVNRQLKLMKSQPPYQYTLDTTALPLLNGRGALVLEAWAYDRAQNRGVAKPITVYVQNHINATPMQADPKAPKSGTGRQEGPAPSPSAPVVTKPEAKPAPRLSPLEALLAPAPNLTPAPTETEIPATAPKTATPATSPSPHAAPSTVEGMLSPAPGHRVDVALAPQPSPTGPKTVVPPSTRPSRSETAVRPRPTEARLDVPLRPAPAAPPTAAGPVPLAPARTKAPHSVKPSVKPAPIALSPLQIARLPEGGLLAVPRSPDATAIKAPRRPVPAAVKPADPVEAPTHSLPKPVVTHPAAPKPATPATARTTPRPVAVRLPKGPERGSTPDRIVLPVYRLARLPQTPATSHTYTVQSGDTLSKIARRHNVTPRSILVANGLTSGSDLVAGRWIAVPGTFSIAFNDQPVGFDVQPRVEGGMAIAPFRQIFEHTGGVVRYHPTEREVQAANPQKEVRIKIGSREALVNSAVVVMDRAAFLDSGRTMVPVKFMTEALDLKAEYDLKTGAIYLIRK
jgi:LysM repeat protein